MQAEIPIGICGVVAVGVLTRRAGAFDVLRRARQAERQGRQSVINLEERTLPVRPGPLLQIAGKLLTASDLIGEQISPAFALDRILLAVAAAEHVAVPIDLVRQSTVDQR